MKMFILSGRFYRYRLISNQTEIVFVFLPLLVAPPLALLVVVPPPSSPKLIG